MSPALAMVMLLASSVLLESKASAIPCPDVRRVAAAALDAPPFASVDLEQSTPRLFGDGCFVSSISFQCHQNFSPATETARSVAEKVQTCLPQSILVEEPRDGNEEGWIVSGNHIIVRVRQRGHQRSKIGRVIEISILPTTTGPRALPTWLGLEAAFATGLRSVSILPTKPALTASFGGMSYGVAVSGRCLTRIQRHGQSPGTSAQIPLGPPVLIDWRRVRKAELREGKLKIHVRSSPVVVLPVNDASKEAVGTSASALLRMCAAQ